MEQTSTVAIRPAAPADGPALGRLGAMLVVTHHAFDPARFIPAGPETEVGYGEFLLGQIEDPDMVVLVAEKAGAVIGYAYGGVEDVDWMALRGPAGVVYDLVVEPARRGEGIGRRLLEAVRAALIDKGAPRIVLSTAERNAEAQALFAKAGFRRTMVEMTWDPPGEG